VEDYDIITPQGDKIGIHVSGETVSVRVNDAEIALSARLSGALGRVLAEAAETVWAAAPAAQDGSQRAVRVTTRSYEVSIFPEKTLNATSTEARFWSLWVIRTRGGRWRVSNSPDGRECLDSDGNWSWDLPDFRLPIALEIARKAAPNVRINGVTATELLAEYQADGKA
jgi:hypothetical protein